MINPKEQLPHDRVNQPMSGDPVFFYPKEFYVFDNFTAFQVEYDGEVWSTAEHAYQAAKFKGFAPDVVEKIRSAKSAHDAFKLSVQYQAKRNPDWENVREETMKDILRCKVEQHPYVLKKLRESGNREIIEDSWRDDFWGWGKDKKGENTLGRLWMEIREEFTDTT